MAALPPQALALPLQPASEPPHTVTTARPRPSSQRRRPLAPLTSKELLAGRPDTIRPPQPPTNHPTLPSPDPVSLPPTLPPTPFQPTPSPPRGPRPSSARRRRPQQHLPTSTTHPRDPPPDPRLPRPSPTPPCSPSALRQRPFQPRHRAVLTALLGDTAIPQWVLTPDMARPVHLDPVPLRTLTPQQVQASAVQTRHAVRVAAKLADFAEHIARQPPAVLATSTPPQLAVGWLHARTARPSVSVPMATYRQCLFALKKVMPTIDRATAVADYEAGMATRTATAPAAPTVGDLPTADMIRAVVAAVAAMAESCTATAAVLAVLLLQTTGLRTPEAVETVAYGLQQRVTPRDPLPSGYQLIEITPFRLKDDKKVQKVRPEARPLTVRTEWWRLVEQVWGAPIVRHAPTRQWMEDTVVQLWHAAGVPDVRMLRRYAAVTSWNAVADTVTSQQALVVVRRVLGHRPDSTSTARYVPDRVTRHDRVTDHRAAMTRRM